MFENIDIPPAHIQSNTRHEFSSKLINYIKNTENGVKKGYKNGKWYPYASIEGGSPTIGYGHKLTGNEVSQFRNGISDKDVETLLVQDLKVAKNKVYNDIKHMFNVNIPTLDQHKEEMLIDFAYNLGTIKQFPKFVRAVLVGDWKSASKQYKRTATDKHGKKIELARNKSFFNTFLK